MFTVYVIKSQTSGKIYVGQTSDINKRLKQHNDITFDRRSYTKLNGNNWIVVYREKFISRKEAIRREKELKSYRGREYIKTILGVGSSTAEQ